MGVMVKDAFTQELVYDLNEGRIIRYKQLKMEIISANNEKIIYKVLSDKPKAKSSEQNIPGVLPETLKNKDEKPDSNKINYIKFPLERNIKSQSEQDTTQK